MKVAIHYVTPTQGNRKIVCSKQIYIDDWSRGATHPPHVITSLISVSNFMDSYTLKKFYILSFLSLSPEVYEIILYNTLISLFLRTCFSCLPICTLLT